MSTPRPLRLLFMTPYGGKTGSETLLGYTLANFDRSRVAAALYCDQPCSLFYDKPADVAAYMTPFNGNARQRLWAKLQNAAGVPVTDRFFARLTHLTKPDYWYINTMHLSWLGPIAQRLGVPVVAHIHEPGHIPYQSVLASDLEALINHASLLIGNAEGVCRDLRTMGGRRVERLYPFVDLASIQPDPARAAVLRQSLGLSPHDFVWLMAGSHSYLKGFDYLPEVSRLLPPNTHVIWAGGVSNPNASYFLVKKSLEQIGRRNVHLVGLQTSDYYSYHAAADGFLLLSREEAFGMVNVEAAYLGKPIVGFNVHGLPEILTEGMGLMVSLGNIPALIEAMQQVRDGRYAFNPEASRARARQFDVATQIEEWHRIMATLPLQNP